MLNLMTIRDGEIQVVASAGQVTGNTLNKDGLVSWESASKHRKRLIMGSRKKALVAVIVSMLHSMSALIRLAIVTRAICGASSEISRRTRTDGVRCTGMLLS
jgi:hypothetical protein